MKLSLCLIVKNEEKYLERCLKSLRNYVDEIIITDTGSADTTVEIAKKYTDKVYHFEWIDDFSAARNFCQSHASGDYILWMDADEWFEKDDIKTLKTRIYNHPYVHFFSCMIVHRKENNHWTYEAKVKVMRNNGQYKWYWKVHEIIDTVHPEQVYGEGLNFPDIYFQHTLTFKDKKWANVEYFEQLFENERENNTVALWLLRKYLASKERAKILYIINNISIIHWKFKEFFILFLESLIQKGYKDEVQAMRVLIKKSLLTHKKLYPEGSR